MTSRRPGLVDWVAVYTTTMCATAQVGLKHGLPISSPVDDAGVFTEEAGPFKGGTPSCTACSPFHVCTPIGQVHGAERVPQGFKVKVCAAGLPVLKEGTAAVIEALQQKGCLLKEERYAHKYPYDWRTKLPTIFRATDQVLPNSCLHDTLLA